MLIMNECSLKDRCSSKLCYQCDIAIKLAEAEKLPSTYVTAKLTDDQFDKILSNGGVSVKSHILCSQVIRGFISGSCLGLHRLLKLFTEDD